LDTSTSTKAESVDKVNQNEKKQTKKSPGKDDIDRIIYVKLNDIKPNSAQPRKYFDEEKLKELALSIEENGVIQPLIVRKAEVGYELVAGERRWRASRIAGIKTVPCIIRNFDDKQNAIVAIIENMQREDLDAIEEAAGLMAMTRKYGFTQEQVAVSLGKSRAYIANSLRLLKLPEQVQSFIVERKISAAHGRTIINIDDNKKQLELCERIMNEGLSVRATEKIAERIKDEAKPERKKAQNKAKKKDNKSAELVSVEAELRGIMGTKVNINGSDKEGKIEIEYYSIEELNRLIDVLRGAF
jgi:ParB family chromosome partitioning protein